MTETVLQTVPILRIFFVRLTGLDEYHCEITAKGYRYMRPGIEVAPWNAKLMEVMDPFGNRLRFNEDLPRE